jgi:hypothetical protein
MTDTTKNIIMLVLVILLTVFSVLYFQTCNKTVETYPKRDTILTKQIDTINIKIDSLKQLIKTNLNNIQTLEEKQIVNHYYYLQDKKAYELLSSDEKYLSNKAKLKELFNEK